MESEKSNPQRPLLGHGNWRGTGCLTQHGFIEFTYYLNPTSLDRNMEWDSTKNLSPMPKEGSQQVRDP